LLIIDCILIRFQYQREISPEEQEVPEEQPNLDDFDGRKEKESIEVENEEIPEDNVIDEDLYEEEEHSDDYDDDEKGDTTYREEEEELKFKKKSKSHKKGTSSPPEKQGSRKKKMISSNRVDQTEHLEEDTDEKTVETSPRGRCEYLMSYLLSIIIDDVDGISIVSRGNV
jgi:hypothetical protein